MHGKHIPMFVTVSTVQDSCNKLRHVIADLVQQQHKHGTSSHTVPYKEALFAVTPLITSRVTLAAAATNTGQAV
jgi:hypothetical protein